MLTEKEKINFSKFGKAFQESLCQIILDNRVFCDQIGEVLEMEYFELKYLQTFASKVYDYKRKYKTHPSHSIMKAILRTEMEDVNETLKKQVRDYFVRLVTNKVDMEGEEYVKEMSLDFCRKQKLKEAMMRSVNLLRSSSFDEISKVINDALKLGSSMDVGHDYLKDFEDRYQIKIRNPVSTGWNAIDDISKGGLGRGELGVVIAPTGAGKSMALVHLGTEALKIGKTVVHYTLELAEGVIGLRYDSCITGFPLNNLLAFKEQIKEEIEDIEGKLVVKEYATRSASTESIKNHLDKLKNRGISPDMIIIDYADLLKPIRSEREKRQELETIYEDLRGLARLYDCPIWTASQTNRSGLNAQVVTMESISEAFNKCFVADFIFSLSRTMEDKNNNTGRIYVAKNRNGVDGLVYPVFMDTSNVSINVLDTAGETPEKILQEAGEKQEQKMKEKFDKFLKKKASD